MKDDFLKMITGFLGLIITVITFASLILNLTNQPQILRVASLVGFGIFCGSIIWFAFTTQSSLKTRQLSLAVLYIITVPFFIWVGTWFAKPGSFSSNSPATDNLVIYSDLTKSADGWEDLVKWDDKFKNPQTIKDAAVLHSQRIERGVAYELQLNQGVWIDYTIQYKFPVQADVIIAHFYLPDTQDIEANWVGIAALDGKGGPWLAASGDSIPLGKWTQVVLDLRDKFGSNDVPLNTMPLYFQVVYILKGRTPLKTNTALVGLDDVAWYQSVGRETIQEHRGAGRTLFDFEDENIDRWQILDIRVQTDTIMISSERVYRGNRAMKWDTRLASGENSFIQTIWQGSPPQGGWTARIYLPDNVPSDASVWANLYTYSESDWQDSTPISLTKGMWNTLVWDTHNIEWGTIKDIMIGVQIGVEGGPYQGPVYIDDIQIFDK